MPSMSREPSLPEIQFGKNTNTVCKLSIARAVEHNSVSQTPMRLDKDVQYDSTIQWHYQKVQER
jgi:hypothetical protein